MTDDMWCLVHFTHLLPCGHYFILLFPLNWPGALASEEGTKLSTWVIKLYLLFNIWIVQVEPDLSYYEKHTEKFLKIHSILCQNILMTIIQDKNSGTPWWFYDWKDFFFYSYLWPRIFSEYQLYRIWKYFFKCYIIKQKNTYYVLWWKAWAPNE